MDNGNSVTTDVNGNILLTGYYTSPSLSFGTTILTNADTLGQADIFLVKYDPDGNVLWANSAGGGPNDYANGVATDALGNVYISGYFTSPFITFGTTTLANTSLGKSDIFLVKYDPSGNVLWAKSGGGTDWDYGTGVTTDASGNVIITGYFASSLVTFGTASLVVSGVYDFYLVKYDAAGNVLWANRGGGSASDYANFISADNNGNILVTGYFDSPSLNFGTSTLTNLGDNDYFLVKYDSAGTALWARGGGGSAFDKGNSVVTDDSGNVVVAGFFVSPNVTIGSTNMTNNGVANIFLVKYDTFGNFLWVRNEGGIASDEGNSIAVDAVGNIFLGGLYTSPSITFGTTTLTNAGVSDIFLVKYDPSGNLLQADRAGGNIDDVVNSVYADKSGNIYLTGFYTSPSIVFDTTILTNTGGLDIFLAKLSDASVTGLEGSTVSVEVDVSPNPFSSQMVLQTSMPLWNATFRIVNYLGQTVARVDNISGKTINFNRGHLPEGLYFIHLTQGNQLIATEKVIISDVGF